MSRYGVPTLKKLRFQYCDWGGSSRGMREFLENVLPTFQANNPHIEVETMVKRNSHPSLEGVFANNARRPIGVKNMPPEDIAEHVAWLRTTHGRRAKRRITATHIVTKRPSIQGSWNPSTLSLVQQLQYQAQEGALPSSTAAAAGQQAGQHRGGR